jgi:glycosyltransferase involved in cell wall biosynthesis
VTAPARATSVLFVNQHYWPDVASTGQHLTDLAEYLAARGLHVAVLTSRVHYTAGRVEAPERETRNGVAIRRLKGTAFGRGRTLGRLADYASFYVRVLGILLGSGRYDGVVFLTTPPLLSFIGRISRLLRSQPYGIWSMDLHPDAEIASGMLRASSPLSRFLIWANNVGYRGADFVVDLGAYMRRRLAEKGVAPERSRTVHVWSDREEIEALPKEGNVLVDELGLRGKFVVMYSGNAGLVHDFNDILEAMRRLRNDPRIYFLFVGGGPRRREIDSFAREHRLTNFAYRDYFPREQLRHSLGVADVHLISLREPFVGIAVPGKLYGIMASARPALFVGPERCESADTIREFECGAVIDPSTGDGADRIVDLLERWSRAPERLGKMGARGRAAFLDHFEREVNCAEWARVIDETWGARVRARLSDARQPAGAA